jgi:uncharacterized protein
MNQAWEKFKDQLDQVETWPGQYTFKFIVPISSGKELEKSLEGHRWDIKPSNGGKYLSYTITIEAQSSEQVVEFYQRVGHIHGLISL